MEAALTTTGRASTARWPGSGKQDGKAYVRNQRLNAPQETLQLASGGSGLVSSAHPLGVVGWGTPWLGDVAGREATVKACGVVVAMLQGHSWAPTPSNGSTVNVGTILAVPSPAGSLLVGGKARRRLMPSRWGGGPVVVRGRERLILAAVSMTSRALSMTRRSWSWHGTGCGATRVHGPPVSTGSLPAVSVGTRSICWPGSVRT